MSESGDVLERFIETLVREITATRPEYLTAPFTVAEIYQDLVPYRSHRDLIGVEMNGDYEDALLRMLSGEGDCLLLESAVARQKMQRELASPNPDTSLFHEFAAADVRLHPGRVPVGAGSGPEVRAAEVGDTIDPEVAPPSRGDAEPEAEFELEAEVELGAEMELEAEVELGAEMELEAEMEPEALVEMPPKAREVGGGRPADPGAETPEGPEPVEHLRAEPGRSDEDGVVGHIETTAAPPVASFGEAEPDAPVSTDAEPSDVLTVCRWCREALPARDSIHFCPFCGSDLRPSPCRECGEAMEARWHFCVSCGADVR